MIKGIIFDYGGTLDSRGVHWSEVLWDGFSRFFESVFDCTIDVSKERFREAYVYGERKLARERIILPQDDFGTLLFKKVTIEVGYMADKGWLPSNVDEGSLRDFVATYCDSRARECIDEARPVLEALAARYPMMLVSNFYGNIDSVLRGYGVRDYFRGIIESAVVGVRKPNPTLFRLGVDALELPADEVLVVGDSLKKDILPAESLGCRVLWLKGKGWTAEEDAQTHPAMIKSITDVPGRIDVRC